jgi:hypothetical protein
MSDSMTFGRLRHWASVTKVLFLRPAGFWWIFCYPFLTHAFMNIRNTMPPTMVICRHPRLPVSRYRADLIGSIKMGIAEIGCEFRQDATVSG